MTEIERKFLVKVLPDLSDKEKVSYERYFIFNKGGVELRVQRRDDKFELERKVKVSDVERTREKLEISEAEFSLLKSLTNESIIRDSYKISEHPEISIKIYHDKYEGLIRAEVEFESIDKLEKFTVPEWFGKEITNSPLARDAELLKLTQAEFKERLQADRSANENLRSG